MKAPRKQHDYSQPLAVLKKVLNDHVGSSLTYHILKDEFYYYLGNKDERLDQWLDYAMTLKQFQLSVEREYILISKRPYCVLNVLKGVE